MGMTIIFLFFRISFTIQFLVEFLMVFFMSWTIGLVFSAILGMNRDNDVSLSISVVLALNYLGYTFPL